MSTKIRQIQLRVMGKGEVLRSGPAGPLAPINAKTQGHLTTTLRCCQVALATTFIVLGAGVAVVVITGLEGTRAAVEVVPCLASKQFFASTVSFHPLLHAIALHWDFLAMAASHSPADSETGAF